jgi:hypothetical protein
MVLVEGPPDADNIVEWVSDPEIEPPVAILVYVPDNPAQSAYYPFAAFSPEWQALTFARANKIPVRFMDLPQAVMLCDNLLAGDGDEKAESAVESAPHVEDPLALLARAAGAPDAERWWEDLVEHRSGDLDVFSTVAMAISALRDEAPTRMSRLDTLREAHMRTTIRQAISLGHERVAVVCGAWHAPALSDLSSDSPKSDAVLLKGLPRVKTGAVWVPWSYNRLTYRSGYGAGVQSPGWYAHLWEQAADPVPGWMTKVARLLREEDRATSPRDVIESVRLAEALAAVRNRRMPGLAEVNDAIQAVMCDGSPAPMALIQQKLIVGEALGRIPDAAPSAPLYRDLDAQQRRLRMKPETGEKTVDLDMRKENDLARSRLLHRLLLLDVAWGVEAADGYRPKGTFHEIWTLAWKPEFAVTLIAASIYGNTVEDASRAKAIKTAIEAPDLRVLSSLIDRLLLCDLPAALDAVLPLLDRVAAATSDASSLLAAVPPLARTRRYSDVRQTDSEQIEHVLTSLVERACAWMPASCTSLDLESSQQHARIIADADGAIRLVCKPDLVAEWVGALQTVCADPVRHSALVSGKAAKLLLDANNIDSAQCERIMGLAVSRAADVDNAAAWLDGFLSGSGSLLIHSDGLMSIVDHWVGSLTDEAFNALLPLVRRTFSTFTAPERRAIGERASGTRQSKGGQTGTIDCERSRMLLPVLRALLGVGVGDAGK